MQESKKAFHKTNSQFEKYREATQQLRSKYAQCQENLKDTWKNLGLNTFVVSSSLILQGLIGTSLFNYLITAALQITQTIPKFCKVCKELNNLQKNPLHAIIRTLPVKCREDPL